MCSALPWEGGEGGGRGGEGERGGGRQVETEGQTSLDTDQQVPALGGNLKAAGEATSI